MSRQQGTALWVQGTHRGARPSGVTLEAIPEVLFAEPGGDAHVVTMSLEDFSDLVVAPFLQFAQRGLLGFLELRLALAARCRVETHGAA